MKTIFTTIITFFTVVLISQSNIEIGTKWTYTYYDFGLLGPTCIEIIGDTIIDGERWFQHEGVAGGCAGGYADVLIREAESKVYVLNQETNIESVLYDYTKTTGESWVIPVGPFVDYIINVDSVGTIDIDGVEYNVQYIDNIEFGYAIIEGIGCTKYFFPQGNICDPHHSGLRCFSSPDLEIDFDPDLDCDIVYLVPPSSTKEENENISFSIFPNPVTDILIIENQNEIFIDKVELINVAGNITKTVLGSSNEVNFQLDLSELPTGIYLVKITSGHREFNQKIVKK